MQNHTQSQFEQLNTLEHLLTQTEGIPVELGKRLSSSEHPEAEELWLKDISRNKRAVIERTIALWVSESTLKPYAD